MDINFIFNEEISVDVIPFVTFTLVNALVPNERAASIVIELKDKVTLETIKRKELNYPMGEICERLYWDYVSTPAFAQELVNKTNLPIPTDIVDPEF